MENKQPGNDKLREKQKQLVHHLSPHLQKQFEELFVHHDRITQILKRDENEKEFFYFRHQGVVLKLLNDSNAPGKKFFF